MAIGQLTMQQLHMMHISILQLHDKIYPA